MRRRNLRLLDVFRVVFETRSVTAAAMKLAVTQPAISKALVELEQDVGLVLFGRERRRLVPTEDAVRLYEETTRLFTHVKVFEDRVDDFRSGEAGQLSIGVIPTLAASIVVQAADALQRKAPHVNLKVITGSRAEVIKATTHHQVDLGLLHGPVADRDLHVEVIGESEIVAAVHRGHAFEKYDFVTPRDLQDQPLICLDVGAPASHLLRECFEAAGTKMRIVMEANSSIVAFAAASSGRCIALIDPWPSWVVRDDRCVVVRFRPLIPQRVSLLSSTFRPPSRLAELFAEELRHEMIKAAASTHFVKGMVNST
ncbi:LysR family transcriptional regulator [Bradyrhizobium vignae]|uniref:LysR family transcriptional regulator n=1 Tax=Bradyrhizobium vignae TaxID=1549949 RepID=A0ABS3ZTX4_9BRAD|nr:LysR family transcriptional regulator [Bradyrhizobium vignae]MBP0110864.1 LysR family transcriptional regulator [Bradyrhizobium vignae]